MASSPTRAVCVTARPWRQVARPAWADEWHVVDGSGDFAAVMTEAFADGPTIKIDDDDTYTADHHLILDAYKGGVVWNRVVWYGCDGTYLGRTAVLSGAVIPPGLTFTADSSGRIRGSVPPGRTVDMGTRKVQCPAEWLWADWPSFLDRIDCRHQVSSGRAASVSDDGMIT